tara:strand:+ start:585 stop:2330 length:1746 start_codon:yes stop_codon:yes gene_type:complete
MLRVDTENLRQEIETARKWRDQHLHTWKEQISRFSGGAYLDGGGMADSNNDPENFAYSMVGLVLPKLAYDCPRVEVEPDDPIADGYTGEVLEAALNRWTVRSSLRKTLQRIATDMMFSWGIAMVTREPESSMRRIDPHHMGTTPRVYRISPEHFIMDPAADSFEESRFLGHSYTMDLEDLKDLAKEDDNYYKDVIEEIASGSSSEDYRFKFGERREITDRDEVLITELWIPELKTDDYPKDGKHNGTIYTLAEGAEGVMEVIADPKPYFGPPSGPYIMHGAYTVPGDQHPLGPLTAADGLIRELNHHLKSMGNSAAAYRRLVGVDARAAKLAQDIANKPDLFVVPIENLDKDRVVQMEFGGVTQQQITYASMTQDRLDRLTGLSEVMRGNIHGDTTATEVTTAATSAGIRVAWLQQQFAESVSQTLWTVGWYLWHDNQIAMPLGKEGVRIAGGTALKWKGGRKDDYAAMSIKVQAHSMQRVDEALQQKRSVELLQLVMQIGQMIPVMPFVDWNKLLDNIGDTLNMPDLGKIINTGGAQQMQQPMQQQGPGGEAVSPTTSVGDMLSSATRGVGAGSGSGRAI